MQQSQGSDVLPSVCSGLAGSLGAVSAVGLWQSRTYRAARLTESAASPRPSDMKTMAAATPNWSTCPCVAVASPITPTMSPAATYHRATVSSSRSCDVRQERPAVGLVRRWLVIDAVGPVGRACAIVRARKSRPVRVRFSALKIS